MDGENGCIAGALNWSKNTLSRKRIIGSIKAFNQFVVNDIVLFMAGIDLV